MAYRYEVITIRLHKGAGWVDRCYEHEADALSYLDRLIDDSDCLLAEVQRWPFTQYPYPEDEAALHTEPVLLVAQADRLDGQWRRVDGELRCRTLGAEAQEILSRARGL